MFGFEMLPEPECESGYPWDQIEAFLDAGQFSELMDWMHGQTMTLCEGRRYDFDLHGYVEKCDGVSHGPVVYRWDVERFLAGGPIID